MPFSCRGLIDLMYYAEDLFSALFFVIDDYMKHLDQSVQSTKMSQFAIKIVESAIKSPIRDIFATQNCS